MAAPFFIPFDTKVIQGTFLKRYKRFLADIELKDKQEEVVHVANPGSMKTCLYPNNPCLISHHNNKNRKLAYSLEAIQGPDGWIGVNTQQANRIAKTFLEQHFQNIRSEVHLEKGWRTDFVVHSPELNQDIIIEVKNVSMLESNVAAFPDSVTKRGHAHLKKLLAKMNDDQPCGLLFIIQRNDAKAFHPAHWIDPTFNELFWKCLEKGMWLSILKIEVTPEGFYDRGGIPLLGRYQP